MKIKICGLTRLQDIQIVNMIQPDYVGFVFAGTKRKISFDFAQTLKQELDAKIDAIGVFVNEPIQNVLFAAQKGLFDIIQLHGKEDDEYIRTLQQKTALKIIKAFMPIDFCKAQNCPADFILLDNGMGTGQTFDWTLIKSISRPFFLAGGICLKNIERAVEANPYAIDVSSGAETNGIKDARKIKELVEYIRKV